MFLLADSSRNLLKSVAPEDDRKIKTAGNALIL